MLGQGLDKLKGSGPNKRPVILGVHKPTEMLSNSKCIQNAYV